MTGLLILASPVAIPFVNNHYILTEEARAEARFAAYCIQEHRLTTDVIFCAETAPMLECSEIMRSCLTWPAVIVAHSSLNPQATPVLADEGNLPAPYAENRCERSYPIRSDPSPTIQRRMLDYFRAAIMPSVSASNVLVIGRPDGLSALTTEIAGPPSLLDRMSGIGPEEVVAYRIASGDDRCPHAVRIFRTSIGRTMA